MAIEAKTNDKPSLPLWCESGHGVKVHQMQHLREVAKAGGFGLIVWKKKDQFCVIDSHGHPPSEGKSISSLDAHWYPIGRLADCLEELLGSD